MQDDRHAPLHNSMKVTERLQKARQKLATIQSPGYLKILTGTIGANPSGESRCLLPLI
ncbi:MAG: hypothetical protein PHG00_06135 [Methylococcales bacterium]|nr:hypothetical protein [Methylococcales bacterium]